MTESSPLLEPAAVAGRRGRNAPARSPDVRRHVRRLACGRDGGAWPSGGAVGGREAPGTGVRKKRWPVCRGVGILGPDVAPGLRARLVALWYLWQRSTTIEANAPSVRHGSRALLPLPLLNACDPHRVPLSQPSNATGARTQTHPPSCTRNAARGPVAPPVVPGPHACDGRMQPNPHFCVVEAFRRDRRPPSGWDVGCRGPRRSTTPVPRCGNL